MFLDGRQHVIQYRMILDLSSLSPEELIRQNGLYVDGVKAELASQSYAKSLRC